MKGVGGLGLVAGVLALVGAACGSSGSPTDPVADGGRDGAAADTSGDVARDVTSEGPGAAVDAPRDAVPDLASDAPSDVSATDTGAADMPSDSGSPDAPIDTTVGTDAADASAADATATADATADVDAAPPNPFAGYHWVALPVPLGTPVTALALDSEGALYAGAGGDDVAFLSPAAGIFKSTDEGASWRAANRGVYSFHVAALAAVGTTIYAGTGGLLRSTDRGATWEQMTFPDDLSVIKYIGAQGDLVMVGSTSASNPFHLSTDAGRTFTPSQFGSNTITSIDVLAGGTVIVRASDTGVLRSTDRGATFAVVQGIMNGFGLAAHVRCDGANTCYALAHTTASSFDPRVMLKSTDAGATWVPLSSLPPSPGAALAISDTGSVYFSSGYMLARSDDGGATYSLVHRPTTTSAFEPNCNGPFVARGDKLFAACPNGVYRSSDKGRHWQPASGSPATGAITGAAALTFVDKTPTAIGATGDMYVVGNSGAGFRLQRSSDGGWTWQTVASPFYAYQCIVLAGGALECVSATITSSPSIPLARSDDHGVTWRSIALPPGSTPGSSFSVGTLAVAGSVVYAAGSGIAKSTDGGLTFQVIPNSPTVYGLQVLRNGHLIATAPTSGAGYRSTDDGATWQPLERLYRLPVIEDADGRLIRYSNGGSMEVSTDEAVTWRLLGSQGVPYTQGGQVPAAIDGAGNLFLFGPGPPPVGSSTTTFGAPLRVVASADDGMRFVPMPDQIPNPNVTTYTTDKQGRLIVATTGGVFRLDADTDPGPSFPDGGAGGNPDGGPPGPAPRPLTMVLENAPWGTSHSHPGFAVDAAERLYRMDQTTIYAITAGTAAPYLTMSEAVARAGLSYGAWFDDMDIGPDGQLYILLTGQLMGATAATDIIVQSGAAQQATLWQGLSTRVAAAIGTIGAGRIAVLDRVGMSMVTGSGAAPAVYTESQLLSTDGNCVGQHLATNPSGAFLYLPGCLSSPVLRGNVDGSGVGIIYRADGTFPTGAGEFACAARDPAGGFFLMATGSGFGTTGVGPRLYHVAEAGNATDSLVHVRTEPSFGETRQARGGGTQFANCSMAVAPNGVIYVQTLKEVWRVGTN